MTVSGSGKAASAASSLLPGFEYAQMEVQGVMVNHAIAGSGPPLLLLHGYPENHLCGATSLRRWRRPHRCGGRPARLRRFRQARPGRRRPRLFQALHGPRPGRAHASARLRAVRLARHDRGARVAHRLVLDHPGVVSRLAVLDIVPTRHVLRNVTRAMATAYYHWFFLATPNGVPEHMIAADPGFWVRS